MCVCVDNLDCRLRYLLPHRPFWSSVILAMMGEGQGLRKLIRSHPTQLGMGRRGCQGRLSERERERESDAQMKSSGNKLAQETRQRYSRQRRKPHKGTEAWNVTIFFLEKCNLSCGVRVKAMCVRDRNGEGLMGHTNLGRGEEESFVDVLKLEYLYPHTWRPRGQWVMKI